MPRRSPPYFSLAPLRLLVAHRALPVLPLGVRRRLRPASQPPGIYRSFPSRLFLRVLPPPTPRSPAYRGHLPRRLNRNHFRIRHSQVRRKAPALAVIARLETPPNKSDHRWIIAENRFRLLGEIPSELNGLDEAEWLWRGRQYDRLAGSIERQLAQQSPSDTARFSLQLRLS